MLFFLNIYIYHINQKLLFENFHPLLNQYHPLNFCYPLQKMSTAIYGSAIRYLQLWLRKNFGEEVLLLEIRRRKRDLTV